MERSKGSGLPEDQVEMVYKQCFESTMLPCLGLVDGRPASWFVAKNDDPTQFVSILAFLPHLMDDDLLVDEMLHVMHQVTAMMRTDTIDEDVIQTFIDLSAKRLSKSLFQNALSSTACFQ